MPGTGVTGPGNLPQTNKSVEVKFLPSVVFATVYHSATFGPRPPHLVSVGKCAWLLTSFTIWGLLFVSGRLCFSWVCLSGAHTLSGHCLSL